MASAKRDHLTVSETSVRKMVEEKKRFILYREDASTGTQSRDRGRFFGERRMRHQLPQITVSHWVFDAFRESAQTPGEHPFKVVDFVREKGQVMFSTLARGPLAPPHIPPSRLLPSSSPPPPPLLLLPPPPPPPRPPSSASVPPSTSPSPPYPASC